MESVRVGGHRYTDPDVLSLIKATGTLVDPRSAVVSQARQLLAKLKDFDSVPKEAFERLKILASLAGIRIQAMDTDMRRKEKRDAVLITTESGRLVLYNPTRPMSRIVFSIAHEISHTFFPNSAKGTRFRTICNSSSKEANELERLCDLGAAELLMPKDEFQAAAGSQYSLATAPVFMDRFGSSFEATAFRLASAHPGLAVSGLLKYRLKVGEQRALAASAEQQRLFESGYNASAASFERKYRRQSLFMSEACDDRFNVMWNKSFSRESIVYRAGRSSEVVSAIEPLPNRIHSQGRVEAVRAPYQREDAHPEFGDVLFLWTGVA